MPYDADSVEEKEIKSGLVNLYRFISLVSECFRKQRGESLNLDFLHHGRKSEVPIQEIIYSYQLRNKDKFPFKNNLSSWLLYKENVPYGESGNTYRPDFSFGDEDSKGLRWGVCVELKHLNNPRNYNSQLKKLASQLNNHDSNYCIPIGIIFHSDSYIVRNDYDMNSIENGDYDKYYPQYLDSVETNLKGFKRYSLVDIEGVTIPGSDVSENHYFVDLIFPDKWLESIIIEGKIIL